MLHQICDNPLDLLELLKINLIRLVMAVFLLGTFTWVTRGTPLPTDASGHTWLWLSLSGLAGAGTVAAG